MCVQTLEAETGPPVEHPSSIMLASDRQERSDTKERVSPCRSGASFEVSAIQDPVEILIKKDRYYATSINVLFFL